MHIHVGLADSLKIFLVVIVYAFFWRLIAAMNKDNSVGQAMAFIL